MLILFCSIERVGSIVSIRVIWSGYLLFLCVLLNHNHSLWIRGRIHEDEARIMCSLLVFSKCATAEVTDGVSPLLNRRGDIVNKPFGWPRGSELTQPPILLAVAKSNQLRSLCILSVRLMDALWTWIYFSLD